MPNKVYAQIQARASPLMPCSRKARHLLDAGKAKIKKRTPFLPSSWSTEAVATPKEVILAGRWK